ncbi:MAG: hypothetical protein F4025_08195 [Synechococcus sp. SB0669_bin_7]|nr:hypothetical protein [Synechococcus sp. SB0669_bin_7]
MRSRGNATEPGDLLLEVLPSDGRAIGNIPAREALGRTLLLGAVRKGRGVPVPSPWRRALRGQLFPTLV